MKERFEDAPESVTDLCRKVRREYFPELRNVAIKFLFDLKKSLHQGQVKIACIMRPNDLLRHFASKEDTQYDGYDYILILDKACWDNVSEEDQERMLRHELRHCWFDIESDKDPYKLVDHEITDFYAEVELNILDPKWRERLASLTMAIYSQRKDEAKDKRGGPSKIHAVPNLTKTPIEEFAERTI